MSNTHNVIHESTFELITDFFKDLDRQGPGSEEVTHTALRLAGELPSGARIADLGCGTGTQTLTLAAETTGHITAIDLAPCFIEKFRQTIERERLTDRITALEGSMDVLPFEKGSLDLIWAEGSIYNIGFEGGLRLWRDYLKPGGMVAVSEATWFTHERPDEIDRFWQANYPGIGTIAEKTAQMQRAGFIPAAHFILPDACWEAFFTSTLGNIAPFLERHDHSAEAVAFTRYMETEAALYRKYKSFYGYVFYIGQVPETAQPDKAPGAGLTIRTEQIADRDAVYDLIREAFLTAHVSDGTEQDFTVDLRGGGNFIPGLSLVAEYDGQLAGHIMFTKTAVKDGEKRYENLLLVAPLSVALPYRTKGVGAALMREGLRLAREMGYSAAILCGDPDYYARFGFRQMSGFGIRPSGDLPEQYAMALELIPDGLKGVTGTLESF